MSGEKSHVGIGLYRDPDTKSLQLVIGHPKWTAYQLTGPEMRGVSAMLFWHVISQRDATEIRRYLDTAFPETKEQPNGD